MALTNKLSVIFHFQKIDEIYDIYQLTTSERYMTEGLYALDSPIESLKAVSLVFDRGKNAFVMFKKDSINRLDFIKTLDDSKLSIKKIYASELKDYVLFRLFLYALANYSSDENMFNNIGGKLFMTHPSWRSKSGKNMKVLEINVDRDMQINAKATTFSSISVFKNGSKALLGKPRYLLLQNGKFRRVLDADHGKDVFVNKGLPGKKVEIPFLDLKAEALRMNRAYFINLAMDQLTKRFEPFLNVSFSSYGIKKKIGERRDMDFVEKSLDCLSNHRIYLTSRMTKGAYEDDFESLRTSLSQALGKDINDRSEGPQDMEIVFLHNKDYYQDLEDPYKTLSRNHVVQCVTLEDSVDKIIEDSKAVINTIFKEMTIKNDILMTHKISLDDWSAFGFEGDWHFGEEKDGKKYFMTIHPDGTFHYEKESGFLARYSSNVLYDLSKYLDELDLKGKNIIMDDKGNINIISRTGTFCIPDPELFKLQTVSRSKESREHYLSGIIDINLFDEKGKNFYNAGLVGSGMNTAIPKANLLYEVTVFKGSNIIEPILETMAVMFVKYNSFTVLPYPMKYLREYMKLDSGEEI